MIRSGWCPHGTTHISWLHRIGYLLLQDVWQFSKSCTSWKFFMTDSKTANTPFFLRFVGNWSNCPWWNQLEIKEAQASSIASFLCPARIKSKIFAVSEWLGTEFERLEMEFERLGMEFERLDFEQLGMSLSGWKQSEDLNMHISDVDIYTSTSDVDP